MIYIENEMDTNIPFIIKNTPYLWLDMNLSLSGLKGWDQKRFSRIYLVSPDQNLYQGYLFPSNYCKKISEYFRGQTHNITPSNYHNIRLNGKRVNLEMLGEQNLLVPPHGEPSSSGRPPNLPISVLYQMLNLPFRTISINNLQIINPSKPPVLIEASLQKLELMFPPGIDYKLIKMTDIGAYSVTHWHETHNIVYEMKQFIQKNIKELTITDATAGVGGDTLCFAQHFKRVNAVELVPLHCITISHNLSVYKQRGNVNLICANYVDVVGLYKPWPGNPVFQNIIYFDPPWGGRQYKTQTTIVLKLDNVPLSQIIWHIIENNLAEYIFVKAPRNVNLGNYPFYKWVKIRNFRLICIKSKKSREKYGFHSYHPKRLSRNYKKTSGIL